MELRELKIKLENELLRDSGILGIGTLLRNGNYFIEISVRTNIKKNELERYLNFKYPQENRIKIIVRDQTRAD